MRSSLVNIGLATANGGTVPVHHALAALSVIGGEAPLRATVHSSDTEPTLVAELRRPLSATAAYAVAQHLKQDAIAQHDGWDGELYGPAKDAWGASDPAFFLTLDGGRLAPADNRLAA
jgi:hypothetical protein